MKKILIVLIIIVTLLIGAIFVPWNSLTDLKSILGIEDQIGYSSLKVYSLGGNLEVSVDEQERGLANFEMSYLEITPLEPGFHKIELVRESTEENFYQGFSKEIYFEEGFDVVISWEAGPSERSSSGWVLSAKRNDTDQKAENMSQLFVDLDPTGADLFMDGNQVADYLNGVSLSLDKRHTISCRKTGFQDIDFEILPEEDDIRGRLIDYNLFLEVKLYEIPLEI